MIQETSLDAFYDLKKTSTIGDQSRKILNVMLPNVVYTRRTLAAMTKLETSTASARINGLLVTHIKVVDRVIDPVTNKSVQGLELVVKA